jgi:hypothetical protein
VVLKELVRHICYSRQIASQLEEIKDWKGAKNRALFLQLLRAHALESRAISGLSTTLRLTPQSTARDRSEVMRKREVEGPKPWDDWQQTN